MPADQYGRPIEERSNLERYLSDPRTGVTKGYYAPLDLPFSLFGSTRMDNGPLSDKERSERKRLNAAQKEMGNKMKLARMKAEMKPKPKPEMPREKSIVPPVKKTPPKSENDKKKYTGKL
jgi:hypothetical protein